MNKQKKIALIYDTDKGLRIASGISFLANKLKYNVTFFDVRKHILIPCIGCFNCWIKTPGVCCQSRTDSFTYLRELLASTYVVYITKITFGGFSSGIKAHQERTLPFSHPFFEKRAGEMHHKARYSSTPRNLTIGYDAFSPESEDTFIQLTSRNMVNTSSFKGTQSSPFTFIYKDSDVNLAKWISPLLEA